MKTLELNQLTAYTGGTMIVNDYPSSPLTTCYVEYIMLVTQIFPPGSTIYDPSIWIETCLAR